MKELKKNEEEQTNRRQSLSAEQNQGSVKGVAGLEHG